MLGAGVGSVNKGKDRAPVGAALALAEPPTHFLHEDISVLKELFLVYVIQFRVNEK